MVTTNAGLRIAISASSSNGLDSLVDSHFGRCPYFALLDVEEQKGEVIRVEMVANPYLGRHEPGQVPAFISSLGAGVMVAGGMGHRAIAFFQQHGIEAVSGASGTVRETLERFLNGDLEGAGPCAQSQHHHGHHADAQDP